MADAQPKEVLDIEAIGDRFADIHQETVRLEQKMTAVLKDIRCLLPDLPHTKTNTCTDNNSGIEL